MKQVDRVTGLTAPKQEGGHPPGPKGTEHQERRVGRRPAGDDAAKGDDQSSPPKPLKVEESDQGTRDQQAGEQTGETAAGGLASMIAVYHRSHESGQRQKGIASRKT